MDTPKQPLNRYLEVSIHSMEKAMKNDDEIIEDIH